MTFRLKSLLLSVSVVAIVLAITAYVREQRRIAHEESWSALQSNDVLFVASRNDASELQQVEIWVSTIDDQTYEVNGKRLSKIEARNKLTLLREDLNCLGIRWYVLVDSEPGIAHTRQSTLDLLYSAGFTTHADEVLGQGSLSFDERRSEFETLNRLYKRKNRRSGSAG